MRLHVSAVKAEIHLAQEISDTRLQPARKPIRADKTEPIAANWELTSFLPQLNFESVDSCAFFGAGQRCALSVDRLFNGSLPHERSF